MKSTMFNLCQHFGVKILISICGSFMLKLFGSDLLVYEILAILVSIDMAMTIWVGIRTKSLSHSKLFKKVQDMVLYTIVLVSFHQLVRLAPAMSWFEISVGLYCAVTEVISIAQNAKILGFKLPKIIFDRLEDYMTKPALNEK